MSKKNIALALVVGLLIVVPALWWVAGREAEAQAKREKALESRRELLALQQGKEVALAAIEYAQDHGERYPDADQWEELLKPYAGPGGLPVVIPGPPGHRPRRFAMNKMLSGRSLNTLASPADAALFFESVAPGPDAADALESLPKETSDGGEDLVILYGDGHGYVYPYAWEQQQSQNPAWHAELLGR